MLSDKVVSWILPTQREFTPFYKCVRVCVCSAPWFGHDIYVGYYCHAESWWLTDINCTFFSFFFCDSQLLRDHCALLILRSCFVDADTFEQAKCMAHILTPYFHHLAPETHFLSGQVPGLTPFMGVKPPVMDAHYIKSVCVCAWSHRCSILRLVC